MFDGKETKEIELTEGEKIVIQLITDAKSGILKRYGKVKRERNKLNF